jgi:hypothetical protein
MNNYFVSAAPKITFAYILFLGDRELGFKSEATLLRYLTINAFIEDKSELSPTHVDIEGNPIQWQFVKGRIAKIELK